MEPTDNIEEIHARFLESRQEKQELITRKNDIEKLILEKKQKED